MPAEEFQLAKGMFDRYHVSNLCLCREKSRCLVRLNPTKLGNHLTYDYKTLKNNQSLRYGGHKVIAFKTSTNITLLGIATNSDIQKDNTNLHLLGAYFPENMAHLDQKTGKERDAIIFRL